MAEQKICPECSSSNGWHKVECGRGRGPDLSTPPVSALPEPEYMPNEADPLALLRAAATTYDSWLDPEGFERAIEHVRADERAKAVCDEVAVHVEAVRLVHELCASSTLSTNEALEALGVMEELRRLRDERAKRPDRDQLEEMAHDWADNADGTIDPDAHRSFRAGVEAVLSSLALEPEAREVTDAIVDIADEVYGDELTRALREDLGQTVGNVRHHAMRAALEAAAAVTDG